MLVEGKFVNGPEELVNDLEGGTHVFKEVDDLCCLLVGTSASLSGETEGGLKAVGPDAQVESPISSLVGGLGMRSGVTGGRRGDQHDVDRRNERDWRATRGERCRR